MIGAGSVAKSLQVPAVWPNGGVTNYGATGAVFFGSDGTVISDHGD